MKKKNNWEELETYLEMKRIFIDDCMMELDAAKRTFMDRIWYVQEYANYVKLARGTSKEAERCMEKVQRLDDEFDSHMIEAHICLLAAAKVYLKGIEYTMRRFSNKQSSF